MVKKWDIYFFDLNPIVGREQAGIRPSLVISNDGVNSNLPILTIVPFSSIKQGAKIYPTELALTSTESGLEKDSVLMFHQIRTISNQRIAGKLVNNIADTSIQNRINNCLKEFFEID